MVNMDSGPLSGCRSHPGPSPVLVVKSENELVERNAGVTEHSSENSQQGQIWMTFAQKVFNSVFCVECGMEK